MPIKKIVKKIAKKIRQEGRKEAAEEGRRKGGSEARKKIEARRARSRSPRSRSSRSGNPSPGRPSAKRKRLAKKELEHYRQRLLVEREQDSSRARADHRGDQRVGRGAGSREAVLFEPPRRHRHRLHGKGKELLLRRPGGAVPQGDRGRPRAHRERGIRAVRGMLGSHFRQAARSGARRGALHRVQGQEGKAREGTLIGALLRDRGARRHPRPILETGHLGALQV